MRNKRFSIQSLTAAISGLMGRVRSQPAKPITDYVPTAPPKDAFHNRPVHIEQPLAIRPRQIGPMNPQIPITDNPASFQRSHQKKTRKNRRLAFANGNRKDFA